MCLLELPSKGIMNLSLSFPSSRFQVLCLPIPAKGQDLCTLPRSKGQQDSNKTSRQKQKWEEKQAVSGLRKSGICQEKKNICKTQNTTDPPAHQGVLQRGDKLSLPQTPSSKTFCGGTQARQSKRAGIKGPIYSSNFITPVDSKVFSQ